MSITAEIGTEQATAGIMMPKDLNRVLVVDDHDMVRASMQHLVSFYFPHCVVNAAEDGYVGLTTFTKHHHAAILMDLAMPEMDGEQSFYEICRFCEANQWELPAVLFYTAYAPDETLRDIVSANPLHAILPKPTPTNELIAILSDRLA